jgi:hypothetical protein
LILNDLQVLCFGNSLAIQDAVGIVSSEATNRNCRGLLTRKWIAWYRVLRYGKGFGFVNSVRYGLWLARS